MCLFPLYFHCVPQYFLYRHVLLNFWFVKIIHKAIFFLWGMIIFNAIEYSIFRPRNQFNIIVTKCSVVACCISLWDTSFNRSLLFVNFRGVTNTCAFANAVLTIGCDDWMPNAGHRFSMVVEQIWVLFQFKYSKKQKTPQKRGFVYNDKKGTLGLLDQVN